jgi:hypothetical protein
MPPSPKSDTNIFCQTHTKVTSFYYHRYADFLTRGEALAFIPKKVTHTFFKNTFLARHTEQGQKNFSQRAKRQRTRRLFQ